MKILIYNDELHSGMQMYFALKHHHQVEIAFDSRDVLHILDNGAADVMFLDLGSLNHLESANDTHLQLARDILKRFPGIQLVGICDGADTTLQRQAQKYGISRLLTRPIRNRDLFAYIQN